MCNVDRSLENKLMAVGVEILAKAIFSQPPIVPPAPSDNILASATAAFQSGKITRQQLFEIINCLDNQTYQQNAYAIPHLNAILPVRNNRA
jgi:hypothetical protein